MVSTGPSRAVGQQVFGPPKETVMNRSPTRLSLTCLAVTSLGLGLTACTTHAAPPPAPATTSPPAAAAPVTPPVTTTPAHSPTPPPADAAGPVHCTSAQLRFAAARSEGAAGTLYEAIRVTNIGPTSCWTYGYVGLQILDASGRKLPTTTLRGAIGALGDEPRRVTLTTGSWGWFAIAYHHATSNLCATAPRTGAQLAITAPGTTQAQVITLGTDAACGQLGLSPIVPASLWKSMGM
jgi:hypothetical protein